MINENEKRTPKIEKREVKNENLKRKKQNKK